MSSGLAGPPTPRPTQEGRAWRRGSVSRAFALLACLLAALAARAADVPFFMARGSGLGACVWYEQADAGTLHLYLRNGKVFTVPWAPVFYHYQPLVLGRIELPEAQDPRVEVEESDRIQRVFRLADAAAEEEDDEIPGAPALRVTVNRLSPAVLLEVGDAPFSLFGGPKSIYWVRNSDLHPSGKQTAREEAMQRRRKGSVTDSLGPTYPYKCPVPLPDPCAPRCFAYSNGESARMGTLDDDDVELTGAENGWLLVWYGADGWFLTGPSAMACMTAPADSRLEAGDAPWLFVFSATPTVRLTADRLVFRLADLEGRVAALPLFGYRLPPARETDAWLRSGNLPDEVRDRCDWWAARLGRFPASVEETLAFEPDTGTLVMGETFDFVTLREGAAPFAPLPPMLALARAAGLPIEISGPVSDSGMATYCGPYAGVETAGACEVRVKGLGPYIWDRPADTGAPTAPSEAVRAVQDRLVAEIDRMLKAGHLAPVNAPFKVSWGCWTSFYLTGSRHLYSAPGQTLRVLAATLPLLDEPRREAVRSYLRRERARFPPESLAHLPSDAGARREPWADSLTDIFVADEIDRHREDNFHVKNGIVPQEALYDLAVFYAALGADEMKADGFDLDQAVEKTVRPWMERADWATLGWYSWPYPARDLQYYGCRGWNMMCEANAHCAAFIGLARLSRLAGQPGWEAQGAAQAARALVHRVALGKYAGWLYGQGDILRVPEGFSPTDDSRGVAMSEDRAILGYGANQNGPLPYFNDMEGPYAGMVPETARFFADHLKPEAEAFARNSSVFYPDAMMTWGLPRRVAEWWHNYPQDSRQVFLVNAWILGQDPEWLARRADVPWVEVGDLYYIEKLAETLKAQGGIQWQAVR